MVTIVSEENAVCTFSPEDRGRMGDSEVLTAVTPCNVVNI
jgi:hypothetical protein